MLYGDRGLFNKTQPGLVLTRAHVSLQAYIGASQCSRSRARPLNLAGNSRMKQGQKKTGIKIPGLFNIHPGGDIIVSSVGFKPKLKPS